MHTTVLMEDKTNTKKLILTGFMCIDDLLKLRKQNQKEALQAQTPEVC